MSLNIKALKAFANSLKKKAYEVSLQEGDRFTIKPNAVVGNKYSLLIDLSQIKGDTVEFTIVTGPSSGLHFDMAITQYNELLHTGFIRKVEEPQD